MMATLLLYTFLLLPVLYVLRKPLLRLITPQGIKGIPAYPGSKPIWGDIEMMGKTIEASNSFSAFFDRVSQDLGPIAQVRAGFFMT